MIFLCFVLLMLLISSCDQAVKIKNYEFETANIRTTKINATEYQEAKKEPEISIISPKDGEIINGSRIVVKLNISNFKLVAPDNYPRKYQGHIQLWVDNMEFRGPKTEFVFENESNGTHVIKAELMLSNNTVLPYSRTIAVIVNKT